MSDTQTPKTTPKDFFFQVGIIATLYVSVISFITLWFRIIDAQFADPLRFSDPYSTGMSLAIASLIVIFPAFLVLSWMVHNDEKHNPEKRNIKIRKWLIFLTVFLAGGAILIDLITLLFTFLSGQEVTTAFVWKVGVVLIVAVSIFTYYTYKIREHLSDATAKYLTAITALVVLGSLVAGFMVMGSPQEQRERRLDDRRVSDLQSIQWQVLNHWQSKGEIPQTLSELADPISGFSMPTDPETGEPYVYTVQNDLTFELCATFNQPSSNDRPGAPFVEQPRPINGKGLSENWAHEAGLYCFERTIDPDLYPVREDR